VPTGKVCGSEQVSPPGPRAETGLGWLSAVPLPLVPIADSGQAKKGARFALAACRAVRPVPHSDRMRPSPSVTVDRKSR